MFVLIKAIILLAIVLSILTFFVCMFARMFLKMPKVFDFKDHKKTGIFSEGWMNWLEENDHKVVYDYVVPRKIRQARYARSHKPQFNAIIKEHYYDTSIATHFFVEYTKFLGEEPCAKHYYKAKDGAFFCITSRLGKKDAFSNIPEKEMKRILTNEPELYIQYIAGAEKNPDLQGYMEKKKDEEENAKKAAAEAEKPEKKEAKAVSKTEEKKKVSKVKEKKETKKAWGASFNPFAKKEEKKEKEEEIKKQIGNEEKEKKNPVELSKKEKDKNIENTKAEIKEDKNAGNSTADHAGQPREVKVDAGPEDSGETEKSSEEEKKAENTNNNTEIKGKEEKQEKKKAHAEVNLEEIQTIDDLDDFDDSDDFGAVHKDSKVGQTYETQSEEKRRIEKEEKKAREEKARAMQQAKQQAEKVASAKKNNVTVTENATDKNTTTGNFAKTTTPEKRVEEPAKNVEPKKAEEIDTAREETPAERPKRVRRKMTMNTESAGAEIGFDTDLDTAEKQRAAEDNAPEIEANEDEILIEETKEAKQSSLNMLDAIAHNMPNSGQ